MSLLLVHADREYLLSPGAELETDLGVLSVPESAEPGDVIETHLGEPFRARRLRGPDCFQHFERTGAPMTPPDVGALLARTGIVAGDEVIDVGTGTGVLAAWLGLLGAEVDTVERDPDAASVARANLNAAGVADRVTVHEGDATSVVGDLGPVDAMTLDTGDASALVETAPDLLRTGGVLGAYVPFVEDARDVELAARAAGVDPTTRETIERPMDFDDRGSRPSTAGIGHTGYLVTGRLLA